MAGGKLYAAASEPLLWTPKGAVRMSFKENSQRGHKREAPAGYIRIGDSSKLEDKKAPRKSCTSSFDSTSSYLGQLATAAQIFPPFLVAGLGMVAAGLLLSRVKNWPVFVHIDEMLIMVPALLGLKGNLEMTLASRLSTHANLGDLDGWDRNVRIIIISNLAVVQCQAIVVGALASIVAYGFQLTTYGHANEHHGIILAASAITAASSASLVLAAAMIAIVISARKAGLDPDNVAGPIAGMLGDFCTLGLLALISESYYDFHHHHMWILYLMLGCYAALTPVMAYLGRKHPSTGAVLIEGWKPVIISMFISSLGGVILRHAVANFHYLSPFAPVMNGAGGNLAAVQSARLCTDLHAHGHPGVMPSSPKKYREEDEDEPLTPGGTFRDLLSKTNDHSATARILILLAIPGAAVFVCLIVGIKSHGQNMPDPIFLMVYICATCLQVCILLVFAHGIVGNLWMGFVNPDNAAIPYVTSLGDVVGTSCLTLAFLVCCILGVDPWAGANITGPIGVL